MAIAFMHTAPRVLLRSIYNFIGLLFDVIVYLYIFLRPSSRLREARKHEDQTNIRINVLKTLFALHGLTVSDFDLFVTVDQIATAAFLKEEEVETALRELPLTVKEEEGTYKYRLDGSSSYLPPLLSFFYKL